MSIHDLRSIVTPPASPFDTGDDTAWQSVQRQLNLQLPDDLKEFGKHYGTGKFKTAGIEIEVFNPFAANYVSSIQEQAAMHSGNKADVGSNRFPYEVYPDRPGLLVWGGDIDGNELCWLTEGQPDEWPIITRTEDDEFDEFSGPFTTFLTHAFQRIVDVAIWPESLFLGGVTFEPNAETPPDYTLLSNIYEIYRENGNCAGFWVRDVRDQEGVSIYVKRINGEEKGPLPGIPNEYGRPDVEGDLYLHDALFEPRTNLSYAYQQSYMRIEPPSVERSADEKA